MIKSDLLSKNDTMVLKGIALLLLLCHHLFYTNAGLFDDIHLFGSHYLVQEIGKFSKVCVTMFVLLSGYGLAVGAEKSEGIFSIKSFYLHRFKKLMMNYWLIWILFVPISIVVFGRTFTVAYGYDVPQQLLLDLFGLHDILYQYPTTCYNPTWWFYSCIILLYLMFPLLYWWAKKDILSVLLFSIAASFLPIAQLDVIKFNILAFIIGIAMVVRKIPPPDRLKFLFF